MIYLQDGLYVRVQELPQGPAPLPLKSGFDATKAYRALGIYTASESSECFFVLSNDRDEVWFISNRHLRTVALTPDDKRLRRPLERLDAAGPRRSMAPRIDERPLAQ